jgi:hypothetical protein
MKIAFGMERFLQTAGSQIEMSGSIKSLPFNDSLPAAFRFQLSNFRFFFGGRTAVVYFDVI